MLICTISNFAWAAVTGFGFGIALTVAAIFWFCRK